MQNRTLAVEHTENAVNLLTEKWINEIAEKNPRVAGADLSNAIIDLKNGTTQTEIVPSDITEKVSEINDISSETISARIAKPTYLILQFKHSSLQISQTESYSKYADAVGISQLPKALSYLGTTMGHGTGRHHHR